jgi:small-conductance mechanosensitive channel
MSSLQKIAVAALLVLLAITGYGIWSTYRPPSAHGRGRAAQQSDTVAGIDQTALLNAQRLSQLATSDEERAVGQSAVQLADHELDLAFAAALRQIEAHPPVLSAEAQKVESRLQKTQKLLEADEQKVTQLTRSLAQASGSQQSAIQDQLDLAKSQLELDQDEVQEANQDLMEAGGNLHQRIQQMMQQHTATEQKVAAASVKTTDPLANLRGLARRVGRWFELRDRQRSVDDARSELLESVVALTVDRKRMAAQLDAQKNGTATASTSDAANAARATTAASPANAAGAADAPGAANAASLLTTTRQIAADQRLLTLMDQRITDRRELSALYAKWSALLGTRSGIVLHASLISIATIIAIVLVLIFLDRWLERLFSRTKLDRRQVGTLRSVVRVSLQVVGIVIILLMLIGVPGQLGTMLGIVGAGLTVALKDFIVGFIGWLVLMGKNGIRLGDWVEINGVSGEVVDLGMFHTVLLETGNWTEAGHPTGRRVTFTNSFAIQGHYFNFSTSGQWLWDELLVLVPYERDPHTIAEALHKEVLAATAQAAHQAEQEWRRAVRSQRDTSFSAAPGIVVRPAVGGVEVAVRYVTRASERFALRARLYQQAVQLLAKQAIAQEKPAVTYEKPAVTHEKPAVANESAAEPDRARTV